MCIRDRPEDRADLGHRAQVVRGRQAEAEKEELSKGRGGAEAQSCLLYTSDAADERSSVDLGGRRIIKKKTKWEIKGTEIIYI